MVAEEQYNLIACLSGTSHMWQIQERSNEENNAISFWNLLIY